MNKEILEIDGSYALLVGSNALVQTIDSLNMINDGVDNPTRVTPENKTEAKIPPNIDFVKWGSDDKLPLQVMDKVYANTVTASNIDFNMKISIGDGLLVVKKVKRDGKVEYEEQIESEQPEIFKFLEENNVLRILQEAAADISCFYDGYIEFILSRDSDKPKIAAVRYKEACFSRLSKMDKNTGRIEHHGYSSKWGSSLAPDDVTASHFLDRDAPIQDLRVKMGLERDPITAVMNNKLKGVKRYVMSLALPTPGRFYYNRAYWWSIFSSGWYDFAVMIPKFKKAILENEMVLKYHVKINRGFFNKLYADRKATTDEKKVAVKKQFFDHINSFLSGAENAGKSFVSHFDYDRIKGYEMHDVIIDTVPSFLKEGAYLEDSEEATNAICYAMGVHPSLQGASPGKSKSINGTEARELFIIKQAIAKPIRDSLLQFLYLTKSINEWDKDIHFVIPNMMLTTLDNNTGQVKSIGNQKI